MQIKKQFAPITLVIETKTELEYLQNLLYRQQKCSVEYGLWSKPTKQDDFFQYLYKQLADL